mmetsp:Transcript_34900/g.104051  ORF Transcript_34900/g.104051 Transcript_34900/m.104051 type:complete len:230 (+) Transcript_34900:582-1271(+)
MATAHRRPILSPLLLEMHLSGLPQGKETPRMRVALPRCGISDGGTRRGNGSGRPEGIARLGPRCDDAEEDAFEGERCGGEYLAALAARRIVRGRGVRRGEEGGYQQEVFGYDTRDRRAPDQVGDSGQGRRAEQRKGRAGGYAHAQAHVPGVHHVLRALHPHKSHTRDVGGRMRRFPRLFHRLRSSHPGHIARARGSRGVRKHVAEGPFHLAFRRSSLSGRIRLFLHRWR